MSQLRKKWVCRTKTIAHDFHFDLEDVRDLPSGQDLYQEGVQLVESIMAGEEYRELKVSLRLQDFDPWDAREVYRFFVSWTSLESDAQLQRRQKKTDRARLRRQKIKDRKIAEEKEELARLTAKYGDKSDD